MSTERATWSYTYEKGLVDILKELVNIPMFRGQNGKSGVGLNDTLGMIIAEPTGWKRLIKDNHKVVKFRKKSFPLYNSLKLLCKGSVATGDLNFTSIEPPPQRIKLRAEPTPQRSISEQSNHSMASIDRNPLNFGLGGVQNIEVQSAPVSRNSEDQDVTGGKKRKQS
uniref:Myb/SANT-like domain-containing protein n=1 Tax=Setaria italica TaxID=4555 RepID=K4A007_SETIT